MEIKENRGSLIVRLMLLLSWNSESTSLREDKNTESRMLVRKHRFGFCGRALLDENLCMGQERRLLWLNIFHWFGSFLVRLCVYILKIGGLGCKQSILSISWLRMDRVTFVLVSLRNRILTLAG